MLRSYSNGSSLRVLVVLACLLLGCVLPKGIAPVLDYPQEPITVALPYVEAVHFPSEIHAGQPFTVEFELSCEQFPDALRSPARPFPDIDTSYDTASGRQYVIIRLFRDLANVSGDEPITTRVAFPVEAMPAGEHVLLYTSAPIRAQGGMTVTINALTGNGYDDDWNTVYGSYRSQVFTVLP